MRKVKNPDSDLSELAREYYQGKLAVFESYAVQDRERYLKAYEKIRGACRSLRNITREEARTILCRLSEGNLVPKDMAGEWQELLHFRKDHFNERHRRIIRRAVREMAAAISGLDRGGEELAGALERRIRPLTICDVLPTDIADIPLHPDTLSGLRSVLANFAHAGERGFQGLTVRIAGEVWTFMAVTEDYQAFETALKHEIVHTLSHLGLLAIGPLDETIAQAVSTLETVRQKGVEGFGDDLMQQLFRIGQETSEDVELDDLQALSSIATDILQGVARQRGLRTPISPEMRDRAAGAVLAGQARQRGKREGLDPLRLVLSIATRKAREK